MALLRSERGVWLAASAAGAGSIIALLLIHRSAVDKALGVALVLFLVPLSVIDIQTRRLPNSLTASAAAAALIIGLALKSSGSDQQVLGGVLGGGFLLIFALAYPRGLGLGDVKLAGVLGLFLSRSVVVAIFAACFASMGAAIAAISKSGLRQGLKTSFPFGPFLAIGGVVAIFAGPSIMSHWTLP